MSRDRLPADDESFLDFLDDYFAECDEHLSGVRRLLLALEVSVGRATTNTALLDELFRHFHSLKGISGMVELRPAEELSHRMEDYLRALRAGDVALSMAGVNALFDATQLLEQVIGARRSGVAAPGIDAALDTIAALVAAGPDSASASPPPSAAASVGRAMPTMPRWRFMFSPSRELVDRGVRVDSIRARLAMLGTIVDVSPHVTADGTIAFEFIVASLSVGTDTIAALAADGVAAERLPEEIALPGDDAGAGAIGEQPPVVEGQPGQGSVAPSHFVRVDLVRLDELMRHIGDLVISRARLDDTLARVESHIPAASWRAVQENAVIIDRQLRTLREGIMRVRLVPVGEIFRRMPFVARDLARETGKRLRLDLQGQATEIDKYLVERMMDPVLHLVRNAISHGIETVDERVAAGKRPEGTITLRAAASGEIVTLEVADDGRGIDRAAIIARAAEVGLPLPASADTADVLALLCAPGFSTREKSDRASGRGVGMAVVKTAVAELGGTLRLESSQGAGTRFIVELPVTLAIVDALIAKVGAETFAIPQGAVREVIEVPLNAIRALEQNEIAPHRGGVLPIVRLARLFGLTDAPRDRLHVLVIGAGASALGLAVDRIVGQREIVVRATADPLVRVEGISGATDLGDGHVVLILDPAVLARQRRERPAAAGARLAGGGMR